MTEISVERLRPTRRRARLGTAFLCVAMAGHAAAARAQTPFAVTREGVVYGTTSSGEDAFRGIRYARPPVGELRWRPPQALARGFGLLDATQFGPHCPQPASPFGIASDTEDCLFLNVYTPASRLPFLAAPRPVMVWIHGGALVTGESDDYDPVRLVTQGDVVVVTINYRLGALGFLAEPALDAEGHLAANYGTLDQQAALRWVRQNIAGFGGDPGNVTIFGESAGGLSVLSNLVSPLADRLFAAAIVESGAYSLALPTLSAAEAQGSAFAATVGCAGGAASCLRAVPTAQVVAHENAGGYTTTVDGEVLPESIGAALEAGAFNHVPVVNGSNRDEGRLFTALDFDLASGPITAASYPAVVSAVTGALAPAVLAQYPLSAYASADLAFSAITTDSTFACPALAASVALSQHVRTYAYEFNDESAPEDFLPPASFPYGAAHASEIQFLFGIRSLPGTPPLTQAEAALSDAMVGYWTRFARAHAPSAVGAAPWAPFDPATAAVQSLAPPSPAPETSFATEHDCAFWLASPPG